MCVPHVHVYVYCWLAVRRESAVYIFSRMTLCILLDSTNQQLFLFICVNLFLSIFQFLNYVGNCMQSVIFMYLVFLVLCINCK